jgi:hypothetical protein
VQERDEGTIDGHQESSDIDSFAVTITNQRPILLSQ